MKLNWFASIIFILCATLWTHPADGAERLSKQLGLRVKTIYLDPSYGGKESGPRLQDQLGKGITLQIAQKLQNLLTADGFSVFLSREDDQFIPLETRVFRGKSKGADLHLAINVSHQKQDCIRILITKPPIAKKTSSDKETKKVDELNKELNDIFERLKMDDKYENSLALAGKIKSQLIADKVTSCAELRRAFDYILLNTDMPAIIVDFGVSHEAAKQPYILNAPLQDQIVHSLATSIKVYADERAPSPQ